MVALAWDNAVCLGGAFTSFLSAPPLTTGLRSDTTAPSLTLGVLVDPRVVVPWGLLEAGGFGGDLFAWRALLWC